MKGWLLLWAVALVALSLPCSGDKKSAEERLIGWKGETYKPKNYSYELGHPKTGVNTITDERKDPWIQVLSWKPRAFVYHNFLSTSEIRHVLRLAAPQMKRSTVVGPNNTGVVDNIRTSAGTFLMRNQDEVITRIEQRLSMWTHLPPSYQEDMQVLRYGPTNKYGAHLDGLERVMSVLIYLIAPEEGGETAFPNSDGWLHPEVGEPTQGPFSPCAQGHVAYKPKQGDALMFFDMTPDYQNMDHFSMHTGCPVIKGVKWNAVKWIHGKPFRQEEYDNSLKTKHQPLPDPGLCADLHNTCTEWASRGECEKNPGFMLGGSSGQGMCRLACKDCVPCAAGDTQCISKNREKGGYISLLEDEFKGLY